MKEGKKHRDHLRCFVFLAGCSFLCWCHYKMKVEKVTATYTCACCCLFHFPSCCPNRVDAHSQVRFQPSTSSRLEQKTNLKKAKTPRLFSALFRVPGFMDTCTNQEMKFKGVSNSPNTAHAVTHLYSTIPCSTILNSMIYYSYNALLYDAWLYDAGLYDSLLCDAVRIGSFSTKLPLMKINQSGYEDGAVKLPLTFLQYCCSTTEGTTCLFLPKERT